MKLSMVNPWASVLFVGLLSCVPAYYLYSKRALYALAVRLADKMRICRNATAIDRIMILEMLFTAGSHVIFVVAATLALSRVGITVAWLPLIPTPTIFAVAVIFGVAGMLATATIARFATLIIESNSGGRQSVEWSMVARSGWLRHHIVSLRILPIPAAVTLSSVQVGCEEYFFRGILLGAFVERFGMIAVLASSLAFIVMQSYHMPSLLHAMFPIIGATVMVATFVPLFLLGGGLASCILAHLCFFFSSFLLSGRAAGKAGG